jgi:plastocyanin
LRRLVPAIVLLACFALPASAFADATVQVEDSAYNPAAVKLKVGESVTWQWQTSNLLIARSVTSDASAPEAFDSMARTSVGPDFTHQFNTVGTYGYHDTVAGTMAGTVTAYSAPSLALAPATSTINRGSSVTFDANAQTNPAGGVLTYEWDLDGNGSYETAGGSSQTVPYASAGAYAVGLRVTDEVGNQASGAATVLVTVPDSDGDSLNDDLDKCVNVPAKTLDGCPPTPLVARTVAPGSLGVAGVRKSGVNVVLSCSSACSGALTLSRGTTPVGATKASLPVAGSTLVTVRLTSAGRTLLARVKSAKLTLKSTVTDVFAQTRTLTRTVNLKTVKTAGKVPAIGISDQQPTTFVDPNFQVLKLKYARLMTPWNGIFKEPARLDAWLQAARAAGVRPLVSFERARGDQCPKKPCRAPSVGQYSRAWTAFHKKYPWIKDISPWNEINSSTQPTGKRPDLAATYYNVVRAKCRGCTIVAADLLDATNIRSYVAAFLKKAKGKPRLWGLHNYTDTNRFRSRGTKALLQSVKGTVWLTETGGVVKFTTQDGKVALPKSESRAKKAMDYMFRLAEANAGRIKRIYVYQWKINNVFDRFDAGVVRADGTPRPSFDVLSLNASIARKR